MLYLTKLKPYGAVCDNSQITLFQVENKHSTKIIPIIHINLHAKATSLLQAKKKTSTHARQRRQHSHAHVNELVEELTVNPSIWMERREAVTSPCVSSPRPEGSLVSSREMLPGRKHNGLMTCLPVVPA